MIDRCKIWSFGGLGYLENRRSGMGRSTAFADAVMAYAFARGWS
jgi:hypothetical protein